jgi:hypothetical protein
MGWRTLVIPVLAGVGVAVAACGGGATPSPDGQWYRDGYNFGVGQQGSPSVQADSPTQFCNAALGAAGAGDSGGSSRLASPAGGGAGSHPTADGTNVPRNVPPVSDYAGESAWVAGCVTGLTSE